MGVSGRGGDPLFDRADDRGLSPGPATGAPRLRMTQAMQQVLRQAMQEPTREFYGFEIGRAVGLPSGTVTPILARLEQSGILTSRSEDVDPRQAGRPRRRYYTFTPDGVERARDHMARTYQARARAGRATVSGWRPVPNPAKASP